MCSSSAKDLDKLHAVCIPYPAQGHISPILKLAKILHYKGFHITFVNTEHNHRRLLKSRGPDTLKGLPSFHFETIPDGLPPCDPDSTQDISSLSKSTTTTCLGPFRELLAKLNDTSTSNVPPVSCVVSDGAMSFTRDASHDLGIPEVLFWTPSACGLLGYMHYRDLVEKGYTPFKETERSKTASAIVVNTFERLERKALESLQSLLPPVYAIGSLHLLMKHVDDKNLEDLGSNLWKEENMPLEWLDSQKLNSVVYVNFGSITPMTLDQLIEFAWGLANSQLDFLWIIRPDIISGERAVHPPEFLEEIKERGMLASWCPQEQVLSHPAIGGFLTQSGWNSTLESIASGMSMICWPFFAEQQTNCWFCWSRWGIGMEIDNNVKRDEVESLVRELMTGEKGKEMKKRALEWHKLAEEAAQKPAGSSYANIDKMVNEILLSSKH
nr:UDP-glycosyltransferase [Nicotiana tabacum]